MANRDDIPELPEGAADMEIESALGKDLRYTPEEGVKEMRTRIELIRNEIVEATDTSRLSTLNSQLADATNRLRAYELQLKSRN